jgi:RNA polymerase sigma factor (sigma-70 family)
MGDALAARTAEQPLLSGQALRVLKDEKLAAMVAAGSDDAFGVLYRRHHQAIYRYCLSFLRQEADARDALQSTMLAALSSLRARPIEGPFKPWLFRIAHNQSISIIRGRAREAPTEAPSTAAFTDDPELREQFRTLVSDLSALPDRQRGAIVMRELSGLSYAEIGAALATSEAGGKQLVYEARCALQDLREGHEMSCEAVRERISTQDRRLLRGRKIRSHLRGCQPCQDFEAAIRRRRPAFALLAPPLSPLIAAAVLQDVFGGGGAGGAGAGGAAAAGGVASGGVPSLAVPVALKATAAVLIAGVAGVGAYHAGTAIFADSAASAPAAATAKHTGGGKVGGEHARASSRHGTREAFGGRSDGLAGRHAAAKANAASSAPDAGTAGQASPAAETAPAASGGSGPAAPAPETSGSDGPGGGSTGGGGAQGSSSSAPSASPSSSPPSSSPPSSSPPPSTPPPEPEPPTVGGGSVPPGTPAGHGGVPPGQGGIPPGQAGGTVPPGHLSNPGHPGGH